MTFKYLLDTNVISEINKKIPNQFVVEKMNRYQREVATDSIVIHKLFYGYLRLPPESAKRKFLLDYIEQIPLKMPVFDYDLRAARWHGEERARLSKMGKIPAFADGQIAGIAFCNDLVLVTNNVSDFEDFNGLKVENWFIGESKEECWVTDNAIIGSSIEGISDSVFLYYFLNNYKLDRLRGGSGQPLINQSILSQIKLQVPDLEEQKKIADVLSCLDAKIDNLRRQNESLEAIAQTLFKHWFIDFEFPNEDGKPYKSSGGEMRTACSSASLPSELGEIPAGWPVGNLEKIIDVRDGTHDSPKQSEKGFYLITSKHLKKEGIDFNSAYLISESDYIDINKRSKVDRYDILLSMIGTVGILYFVLDEEIDFAIKNIGLFKTSQNLEYSEFLYLFLNSTYGKSYFRTRLAGTTQSYITLGSLREMPIIIPNSLIIDSFRKIILPIFKKYHLNNQQIQTLTKTRDTLLPKLMSGKLRVRD